MRPALRVGLLIFCAAGLARSAGAELPAGRGVLLPLQDRVGDGELAELTETSLRGELEARRELAPPDSVRAVLRSLRIRDAAGEPPQRLASLAERVGADWFFLATLHEARAGRGGRRVDGGGALGGTTGEDDGATPQFTLSARIVKPDSDELWWAGFRAGTGRDGERAFGLGREETLAQMLRRGAVELVAEAEAPRRAASGSRGTRRAQAYLRSSHRPAAPDRVAVVPMDSVARTSPGLSSEVVTAALLATLDAFGFKTLLPGLVETVRREADQGYNGGVSRPEWEALARRTEADWVATGTVETYALGQGVTPDPRVAFAVRFVDCRDGEIGWLDGLELSGSDTAAVFDRGRIYATGDLAWRMMDTLFGGLNAAPGGGAGRGR